MPQNNYSSDKGHSVGTSAYQTISITKRVQPMSDSEQFDSSDDNIEVQDIHSKDHMMHENGANESSLFQSAVGIASNQEPVVSS